MMKHRRLLLAALLLVSAGLGLAYGLTAEYAENYCPCGVTI